MADTLTERLGDLDAHDELQGYFLGGEAPYALREVAKIIDTTPLPLGGLLKLDYAAMRWVANMQQLLTGVGSDFADVRPPPSDRLPTKELSLEFDNISKLPIINGELLNKKTGNTFDRSLAVLYGGPLFHEQSFVLFDKVSRKVIWPEDAELEHFKDDIDFARRRIAEYMRQIAEKKDDDPVS